VSREIFAKLAGLLFFRLFVIFFMPDLVPNADLLRSLGRLVRGLSALFWGLPLALIICFYTARADGLKSLGMAPPIAATALLVYGLWQLGTFQKQERVWRNALDRAQILSVINCGLSPFLFWWNRIPSHLFYTVMVALFALSALLLLASVNLVLQRLSAMLPDEGLRIETKQFTTLNLNLLLVTFLAALFYWGLGHGQSIPRWLGIIAAIMDRGIFWFLIVLVLLPLAMTMALLWKTKEVILESIFSTKP
jgi:hypothetical protein